MDNYILKLTSGTTYKLYNGTTLVSDTDLTTLFTTAGSIYLSFDFDGNTPSATDTLTITNSNDATVISNSGLTTAIAEGKNYKATWSDSATTFDTFEELQGKALDESQLSFLMEKIKNASSEQIIEKDFRHSASGYAWDFFGGADAAGKIFRVVSTYTSLRYLYFGATTSTPNSIIPFEKSTSNVIDTKYFYFSKDTNTTFYHFIALDLAHSCIYAGLYGQAMSYPDVRKIASVPIATLDRTDTGYSLDASQGKVLADRIGALTTLTTTAKTSTVAAINELNAMDVALVGSEIVTPGSTATISTANIQDGAVTSAKLGNDVDFLKLTMSTTDIGEGATLAANTLYGVYEDE